VVPGAEQSDLPPATQQLWPCPPQPPQEPALQVAPRQAPPAGTQRASPAPGTQQASPWQVSPAQQGCCGPPHAWQVVGRAKASRRQTSPWLAQPPPLQQGAFSSPHITQRLLASQAAGAVHRVASSQQG
jgi:hypothetical protein